MFGILNDANQRRTRPFFHCMGLQLKASIKKPNQSSKCRILHREVQYSPFGLLQLSRQTAAYGCLRSCMCTRYAVCSSLSELSSGIDINIEPMLYSTAWSSRNVQRATALPRYWLPSKAGIHTKTFLRFFHLR